MTTLEVSDLFVRYGKSIVAVQGASFSVKEGEIVSLLGQNGAGKSTVLKTIAGVVSPLSGAVTYGALDLTAKGAARIPAGIAYVPEDRGVFGTLTVGENLRLGAISRKDKAGVDADIEAQLDRFPILRKYWSRGASLLSGGEQQQLAIARALMIRPNLLLLDEPTLGLAPIIVDLIFDVIAQLNAEGMTILLVEQNAVRSIAISHRSYVVQAPGRIIGSGNAEELAANAEVVEYLGFSPLGRPEDKEL
ncbi:ABC transporter ATP-binding protein [Leucobacter salsicius]|uniref:ABC transporter ATP-binding protein n=1 Tax=Leucobacter salsicius TaxID=664638 RepID=UPI00034B7E35|nr:ABC transporter ATP-binding protein [Leucobacter salsicius]